MLIPAGIAVPFSAVFVGANPARVAMSVYDDSGSSPSLLLAPFLMNHTVGDVYSAKFTPVTNKSYVIVMAVYTDGTFTTVDGAFPAQSAGANAQYISVPLQSMVGRVENTGAPLIPFSIFLGDKKTMALKVVNDTCCDDGPLDLTSCTEIDVALQNQDGTIAHRLLTTGQVAITSPAVLGKFTVPISAVVSALLNVGQFQNFDVTFTIAGEISTVRFSKGLSVFEVL